MKYSALIDFQPIEDVIQLKSADDDKKSREYVKSYVMSDKMAAILRAAVVDQLKFDNVDSKGVLIVGNYGTGKSHLMSVISAVAHDKNNLPLLKNKKFAADMEPVAGNFEVLRLEIGGSVTIPLRKIIFSAVREDFSARGISIAEPDFNEVWDNKKLIRETMNAFEKKYPDKGFLLVVDEFFSYLSTRDERQITQDLEFLRNLSEMGARSKLRIIFGVQEKIFDNPRFSFVSDTLRHVSDRFTQVVITKDATSYVVAERILKKSPAQKILIRQHLEKFCNLYEGMAARLDDFVELFPIHPAYIDVFDKIHLIENRHVLKNISLTIKNIFDAELPDDAPGIISFDDYWQAVKSNIFSKNQETISRVVEASSTLENIINRSFRKAGYKPLAIKIIHALSVHRLTTNGLDMRFGLTAENLRDDLCLYLPLPVRDSNFLLGVVRATLDDIIKTVSGQFIVRNEANGQFYIDVDKTVDYDENIRQKASLIAPDDLNQYFYQLILDAVSWNKLPYVPNFKIYEHDLNWHSKNIFREGYLFLGLPEDRSTAQPERDFYIHIMPPFTSADAPAKILDDEVYFHFKPDDASKKNLALYAAARKLEQISDGKDRTAYQAKANDLHKNFVRALGTTSFDVVYKGTRQRLVDILRGYSLLTETFGDTLDLAAALCLEDYFCKKYPDFPAMKIKVTRQNIINLTREAYDYFAGKTTNAAAAMLRSFEILDGNEIRPEHSHFAKYFIERVNALPPQGVLNYSDLFEDSGIRKIDKHFKIPFDLTPIIFLAMVYGGFAEITFGNGSKLTAGNLEQRLNSPSIVSDLIEFKYLSRASEMPLAALKKFFTILNLNPAQLTDPNQINIAVKNLLDKAQKLRNAAVSADGILSRNFELMGESLVTNQWLQKMKDACNKIRREFDNYHARFDTPAKLHNFNLNDAQLDELAENLRIMNFVREYANFRTGCLEAVTYLANVEFTEHLKNELEETKRFFRIKRQSILSNLKGDLAAQQVCQEIAKFKKLYSHFYFSRHAKNRLNADDAKRKGAILESQTFANLRNLSRIGIFSTAHFKELEQQLAAMKICYELSTAELDKQTTCPHCHYRLSDPDFDAREQLDRLEALPDKILREWEKILLDTLSDPLVQPNMQFLNEQQRLEIQHFLSDRKLPPRVEDFFIVSVKALLKNYQQVVINANDFIRRLEALPPLDERNFRRKIDEFISQLTAGKDPSTVRISIKRK